MNRGLTVSSGGSCRKPVIESFQNVPVEGCELANERDVGKVTIGIGKSVIGCIRAREHKSKVLFCLREKLIGCREGENNTTLPFAGPLA